MNGYNFTSGVRELLGRSREEAARLHHEYVGTEHLLLAIGHSTDTVAAAMLERCGVARAELERRVEAVVLEGKSAARTGPDLPYTSRAKKVLELSMSEARERGESYVGTGHLLLGLLLEEKGIGAQVLQDMGVSLKAARASMNAAIADGIEDKGGLIGAAAFSGRKAPGAFIANCIEQFGGAPKIAAVFRAHGIDVPRLLDDLRKVP